MNENQYGRVSVIIPARNEELNIARVVRSLAKQSGIREILVVNDQSTDHTGEILTALEVEISSPPHFASGVIAGRLAGQDARRSAGGACGHRGLVAFYRRRH